MKKFKVLLVMLVFGLTFITSKSAFAYVLNGQNVGYNAYYKNQSSMNAYLTHANKITTWNYNGARVFLSAAGSTNYINIYQSYHNTDSGTYATAYFQTSRQTSIAYYKLFDEATNAQRNETVVHEIGHALGLAHTQNSNNANAVMRATGFNGKAYPLQDDKNGMNAKY